MANEVQLITYVDRLGGDFAGLRRLLGEYFPGVFGGVHALPFFTPFDGADAGFDPVDHTVVDPRLGDWASVAALADEVDLTVDVIVNHVSSHSAQFLDVVAGGDGSRYASMFLTLGSVFPAGATEDALAQIYRPRPGLPFTPYRLGGEPRLVWTTFTGEQIDIDVRSPTGREYLVSILDTLSRAGVTMIRLDAVGYAIKTAGTSCFMTPETFEFIDELTALAHARDLEVLVEVHSFYRRQVEIAHRVDRVYDFALPPLVLHAAHTGDHAPLLRWLDVRPGNAVTVLDTHDGIGIIDVGPDPATGEPGLLDAAQIDALVEHVHVASAGQSREATGAAASNLDLYQVNCTYLDALGGDEARYLAARAVQLFCPGIPQVYYVGALAGHNDMALLAATGVGRDINRHRYTGDEVRVQAASPAVVALAELCRFRNRFPAFSGTFAAAPAGAGLGLTWTDGAHRAELVADLAAGTASLRWSDGDRTWRTDDLLADPPRS
ncbi:sucrose phosphorylase [Cellulomonas citrea]|uniref:sucrose phosphorylase n=1 Tax=Cellulomonas citrea TaxID=1909423 RepID=UPI001357756E|nr:sucrose phosphorylase [Cellulomonas citrea]